MSLPLPLRFRALADEVEERLSQIPSELNEYGYDPFGMHPSGILPLMSVLALLYRHYFRVETRGIENVPPGRVVLIANHAGNTLPADAAMLGQAMLLEAEPPRILRSMAEFYLPQIPWFSELIDRVGSVVGTPENCVRLLERDEAVVVFPEGHRGFIKPYSEAYRLQRFGSGFVRIALQAKAPIVPVGSVGSEEQNPGLLDAKPLGRLIGAPAFPVTFMFPLFGVLGFLPLPVKFRIYFGEPIRLVGEPSDDDQSIQAHVDRVRDRIALLLEDGLADRRGWFA
jgi:1-acyl-sn-glycerol-3-phosphate acyltransferase